MSYTVEGVDRNAGFIDVSTYPSSRQALNKVSVLLDSGTSYTEIKIIVNPAAVVE